jgi:acetyl-CoA carboxylase carboxyltransferase component
MKEKSSYMFVTGPKVTKTVTGEDISTENWVARHSRKSGTPILSSMRKKGPFIRKLRAIFPRIIWRTPLSECDDPIDRKEDDQQHYP